MIVKLEASARRWSFTQAKAALVDMLAARELERATTELVGALVKNATIVP